MASPRLQIAPADYLVVAASGVPLAAACIRGPPPLRRRTLRCQEVPLLLILFPPMQDVSNRDPRARMLARLSVVLGVGGILTAAVTVVTGIVAEITPIRGSLLGYLVGFAEVAACVLFSELAAAVQQRCNRSLAAKDNRGYFVYIRSCGEQSLQTVTLPDAMANDPNGQLIDDIPAELADALVDVGTLFIIGQKGAGSLEYFSTAIVLRANATNWRRIFRRLASGARCVFVTPGSTPGLLEEFDFMVQEQLLHKLLVIMPPATGKDNRNYDWNAVAGHLQARGLRLPPFDDAGMICRITSDLHASEGLPYVVHGERRLPQALAAMLSTLPVCEATSTALPDLLSMERGAA